MKTRRKKLQASPTLLSKLRQDAEQIIKDEAIKGNQIDYSTAAAMERFRAVGLEGTLQGSSIRLLEGETQADGTIGLGVKLELED